MGMHFTLKEKNENRRTREKVFKDLFLIGFPEPDEGEDESKFYLRTGIFFVANENDCSNGIILHIRLSFISKEEDYFFLVMLAEKLNADLDDGYVILTEDNFMETVKGYLEYSGLMGGLIGSVSEE
jgi:hypothetical protein